MSGRRKKPTQLSQSEIDRFMADAERLHVTLCQPLISPQGEHYRACLDLNDAIGRAFIAITGKEAPWASRSSSGPVRAQ